LLVALFKHPFESRAAGVNDSFISLVRHVSGTNRALNTSSKSHIASVCLGMADGRYRMHSGHCLILALSGSVANDPQRQFVIVK
jgi:hypothetical protein